MAYYLNLSYHRQTHNLHRRDESLCKRHFYIKKLPLLLALLWFCAPEQTFAAAKLRPESLASFAQKNPDNTLPVFIFSTEMAGLRDIIVQSTVSGSEITDLPVINAVATQVRGSSLNQLSSDERVLAIHYIDEEVFSITVNIVAQIQRALTDGGVVMNFSIVSPHVTFDPGDPVNLATYVAWLSGSIAVMSAGNAGQSTINPWCTPYVICVGAAMNDGSDLWTGSSRADSRDASTIPTVVAPGVDVVVGEKTITGTSPATVHVSAIATLITWFVHHQIEATDKSGKPTFQVIYDLPLKRTPDVRVGLKRTVGELTLLGENRIVDYPAVFSPALLKQMIMDMAVGVKDYQSESIGAGFVNYTMAWHYFRRYGKPELDMYLLDIGK